MKKKKKKKKPSEEEALVEEAIPEASVEEFAFDGEAPTGEATWLASDRDYTYSELLGRVFSILRQNNPDLAGDRRKFTIIPPIIGREGSKKTAFTNISELCRRMRRPVEHVTSFLLTEMGTTGSMDANQRLIIKGRFQQLQVENLLRRYIGEYVTCKTCRSPETQLSKESRLFFMKCDSCGSSRSVAAIKAGFKAQTGRRVRTG
jgi:translation initiation factor 2 subunit 2